MRVRLFSNGAEAFLSPFVSRFTANICKAIVTSLKAPRATDSIHVVLEGDIVQLRVDGIAIALDERQGFAGILVSDTIRGMIRHLKGIDPDVTVRIEVELEGHIDETQG